MLWLGSSGRSLVPSIGTERSINSSPSGSRSSQIQRPATGRRWSSNQTSSPSTCLMYSVPPREALPQGRPPRPPTGWHG